VNSKEDFVIEGNELKRINSKEDLVSKRRTKSISLPDLVALEEAVFHCEKKRLTRAMQIAKKSHCDEGLLFLELYKKWKEAKIKGKAKIFKQMRKQFFAPGSSHEVFLPEELRNFLMNREDVNDIVSAKRYVLNDIRFNDVILVALLN
jgi:hypothetical protein